MKSNIEMKQLKSADLPGYKQLIDACFGSSESLRSYEKIFAEDKNYKIFIATLDGQMVGAVTVVAADLFTFSNRPFLMLFDVCVLDEYRKSGVGLQLMEYIKAYGLENKYKSINMTCLESAIPAHGLYEKAGFVKTDSRKYSIDLNAL
jgi:predicted N-acetyltransferase YhbS